MELASSRSQLPPGEATRLAAVVDIEPGWHLQANPPTFDYLIPTVLEIDLPPGFEVGPVQYPESLPYRVAFAEEPLAVYEGRALFRFELRVPPDASGSLTLHARLRYQACDDRTCLPPAEVVTTTTLPIGMGGTAVNAEFFQGASGGPKRSLLPTGIPTVAGYLSILGLAVLGGLILNAMPCVLPVLSLKAMGLVRAASEGGRSVRSRALATSAGILLAFWSLATLAVLARTAGASVGWGIQFQEPRFVAALALVVLLFTLNLWGLFEIHLPGAMLTAAERRSRRSGLGGDLAAGAFTTLMATPCSAPFLGTALSFALTQSGTTIVAVFTAIGCGLALPYLALAAWPGAVRWLPRPGSWMESLKGALGFLLAGALVWLLFVLQSQVTADLLAFFQLFLLAVALFIWLASRSHSPRRKRLAWAIALLWGVGGILLVREAPRAEPPPDSSADISSGIPWIPFNREEALRLVSEEGRLVFVDITADWCVTCKVNERLVLSRPEVSEAFKRYGVIAMKGDWTNRNDEITRFLAEHGRYGIPFYLLYRPSREPLLFGELITRQSLLEAVAESSSKP